MTAETLTPDESLLPLSQALLLPRIAIESTTPVIDGGEFAVKAVVGQRVNVTSKVFADGHDKLAVLIRWRPLQDESWHSVVMTDVGNNGWEGAFTVAQQGPHEYCIEAWIDTFASFCYELRKNMRPACRSAWSCRKVAAWCCRPPNAVTMSYVTA